MSANTINSQMPYYKTSVHMCSIVYLHCNTYAFSEMCWACIRSKWYFQAALAGARYSQDCGPYRARFSQDHGTDQDGVEHRASEGRVRNSQAAIYAGADGCLYTKFGDSVTAQDSRRGPLSQHEHSSPRYETRYYVSSNNCPYGRPCTYCCVVSSCPTTITCLR